MIITVSGRAASGKSSVAKLLAEKLGYKHHSAGDLQRETAKEMGVTITELNQLEQKDDTIDKRIDAKTKELGEKEGNFVIDAWLAPHFIPHAFHVFLDGDEDVRIKRRISHRRKEESHPNFEEAKKDMNKREAANRERWKRYYDYDFMDSKNYDLIVDTTKLSIQEVIQRIVEVLPK